MTARPGIRSDFRSEVQAVHDGPDAALPVALRGDADQHLLQLLDDGILSIRMSHTALEAVLQTFYKNQHYADREPSGGSEDPPLRDRVETTIWHIARDDPDPASRPVYGYFATFTDIDPGWLKTAMVRLYGPARVVLKPQLSESSYLTFCDSLYLAEGKVICPSEPDRPRYWSVPPHVNPMGFTSIDDTDMTGWPVPRYVEGQIFGRVDATSIDHVLFTQPNRWWRRRGPHRQLRRALRRHGIPWSIV